MAERNWTPAQRLAMREDNGNLLVSAAAGSGKTATLTEKVVRLILAHPETDVTRLLIVTFTRAAAAELRERIAAGLSEALRRNPENRLLNRRLADLERAPICTIHSFCLRVLRPHFADLGLPPDFSVAEETAAAVMRRDAMAEAVNAAFAADGAENEKTASFEELADALGSARDQNRLDGVLLAAAERLRAFGCGGEELLRYADEQEQSAGPEGPRGAALDGIRAYLGRMGRHYAAEFRALAVAMTENPLLEKAYVPAAQALGEMATRLENLAVEGTYGELRALFAGFSAPRLGAVKEVAQTEESALFKSEKTLFVREIGAAGKKYFTQTPETASEAARQTARLTRALGGVISAFDALYTAEKRQRNVLDYGDLETETHRLLVGADGAPTPAALETAGDYDAVFVDEYQDTNRVQDEIFAAISVGKPRYLVGDVKQSIYAFRGADPSVFSAYRRAWPPLSPQEEATPSPSAGRSVFMNENFRCDRPVIDFTNALSDELFPCSGIAYSAEEDALRFAKPGKEPETPRPVEVCVLPARSEDPAETEDSARGVAPGEDPEAAYVAGRIAGLLGSARKNDGTAVRPGDVAILLRSPGAAGSRFAAALEKRGIPVRQSRGEDFFSRPEILLALCLLNAVDNPSRDVYLAGYMKSPLCGFSLEELLTVRRAAPGVLWDAVRAFAAAGENAALREKCAGFCAELDGYRARARGTGADRLLHYLYRETGILYRGARGGRAGDGERRNLLVLYDMARQHESGGGGGLYGFLRYIRDLTEREGAGPETTGQTGRDAVQILSIHQSKGLEYPVVFLCDTARRFNFRDAGGELLFDPAAGVAMRLPDPGGSVRCETLQRQTVARQIRDRALEEEMRVLYVALTRARERLIVTGRAGDPAGTLRAAQMAAPYASAYTVRRSLCYLDWIMGAAASKPGLCQLCFPEQPEAAEAAAAAVPPEAADPALQALFRQRMAFRYPYEYLAHLPAKLIVSKLYPGVIDPEDEPAAAALDPASPPERRPDKMPLPVFLSGMPAHTAAQAGIATHSFFEFCHLEALGAPDGIRQELDRLVREGFITEEMRRLVRTGDIEKFLRSALYARMCRARHLEKEFRFYAAVPASQLTRQEEWKEVLRASGADVLVQGVVDCFFEDEAGRLVLVDYKTDHLTPEELASPVLAAEKLRPRHREQLLYYRRACEKMLGRPVDETYVYSLPLGACIAMD